VYHAVMLIIFNGSKYVVVAFKIGFCRNNVMVDETSGSCEQDEARKQCHQRLMHNLDETALAGI